MSGSGDKGGTPTTAGGAVPAKSTTVGSGDVHAALAKARRLLERLSALPEHLKPHHRRFYVEAVSDETKSPMIEFYRQQAEAEDAAQAFAKATGAEGFYPPGGRFGREPTSFRALSFKRGVVQTGNEWVEAGRGYIGRAGHIAVRPSKRPAGKAITAEIEALPKFPADCTAMDHLGAIDTLRHDRGFSTVGSSGDGRLHFAVPFKVNGRYFISAPNHNFDISSKAQEAAEALAGDHPEWAPSLDFLDDPISWRPGDGWALLTKAEIDFIIAEENMRRARLRAEAA